MPGLTWVKPVIVQFKKNSGQLIFDASKFHII